ncbi:hypothetical protein CUN91_00595 [Candidatus Carsonella ruddii]|uniref:5-methyltetrahydropteroyltriglutamate--homocysteine S-methyltransferase n=1 Tax=Carsonella ruddii TaxID=114186 RepID=A0A2K8K9B8_CARRU|nr:hypothetical protein [Candidatus Carsonella ruddii]ATX33453.1 hypothetical protein CUN91_00595 [Candidatus Carsonella ruddii]
MINSYCINSPNIGKYRELKKYTEKYWKNQNVENLKKLIMISKKIKFEKILNQTNNNFLYINFGDFSFYDYVFDISCLINSFNNNSIINIKKYFSFIRGTNYTLPCKMTKFFDTNYHYIIPYDLNNLKLLNNFFLNDLKKIIKIGILPTPIILGPLSYLFLCIKQQKYFKKLFEIYILIIKKIKKNNIQEIFFDEPILCCKINSNWKKLFNLFYNKTKKIIKIIIISSFNFNKNNFDILNNFEYNLNLEFKKNNLLEFIKKNNFNIIQNNLNKTNILFLFNFFINKNIVSITSNLKYIPYNLYIENFENKKYLSFFFQKINELKLIKEILNKNLNSYNLLYLINFKIYNKKLIINNKFNKILKKSNKLNKKLLINNTIGSFPQNKEIKISRKQKNFFLLNEKEYNNILKENIYLCFIKQIKLKHQILVNGEFERTDMVEFFAKNIKGINVTKNGWVQSYGTRYVKPPIILNIENSLNITNNWYIFTKKITKKKIKIIVSGPITMLKWSFFDNNKIKFLFCFKLSEIISLELLKLQNNGFKIFQIDEPTIKECLNINKKYWKYEINNFLFCFNNCTKFIKKNNEIHSHVCYSIFNDIIKFIEKINIDILSIESTREKMENLNIFKKTKLNLGAGIYDVHSPIIPYKKKIKKNIFFFVNKINFLKILINPDCGLKTRNWYELNFTFFNINNILNYIKNFYY